MKKTYMNPTTKIVRIQLHQMIAASPEGYNSTLGTKNVSGSAALGRDGGSFWDDDEE